MIGGGSFDPWNDPLPAGIKLLAILIHSMLLAAPSSSQLPMGSASSVPQVYPSLNSAASASNHAPTEVDDFDGECLLNNPLIYFTISDEWTDDDDLAGVSLLISILAQAFIILMSFELYLVFTLLV